MYISISFSASRGWRAPFEPEQKKVSIACTQEQVDRVAALSCSSSRRLVHLLHELKAIDGYSLYFPSQLRSVRSSTENLFILLDKLTDTSFEWFVL